MGLGIQKAVATGPPVDFHIWNLIHSLPVMWQ